MKDKFILVDPPRFPPQPWPWQPWPLPLPPLPCWPPAPIDHGPVVIRPL